jgi:hypothetical protein
MGKRSILKEWKIDESGLTKIIDENPSLRGMLLARISQEPTILPN